MNLVLGDIVETIYVADEDDDDKEDIKVGPHAKRIWPNVYAHNVTDCHKEVGDAVCSRYVFLQRPYALAAVPVYLTHRVRRQCRSRFAPECLMIMMEDG